MWILILITFSAPMEIENIKFLETHWEEEKCVNRLKQAIEIGMPKNTNLGCVFMRETTKANR